MAKRLGPALLLGLLFLILSGLRFHTYNEPLDRDITNYSVIAHQMRAGHALYADLWDHRAPLIFLTFYAAESAAGYGRSAVYLLNVLGAAAVLFGVYVSCFGDSKTARRWTALWGALLWVLISGDCYLQGNQPNTELFMNACLIWAFAFLQSDENIFPSFRRLMVGFLFALATLYKHVALAPIALLSLAHIICSSSGSSRRQAIIDVAYFAGIGAAVWVSHFVYFWGIGHGQDFIDHVFRYNWFYIHNTPVYGGIFQRLMTAYFLLIADGNLAYLLLPLLLFGAIGGTLAWFRPALEGRAWGLWLAYLLGSFVAVAWPGKFFAHYYQLLLPPLILGTVLALDVFRERLGRPVMGLLCIALLAVLAFHEVPLYALTPDQWSNKKYEDRFLELRSAAEAIESLLQPGETFYNWGNDSGLYFESRHEPPTGVFLNEPLVTQSPFSDRLSQRVLADLEKAPPKLVVVSLYHDPLDQKTSPVLRWIVQHYRPATTPSFRNFVFLLRKNP